MTKTCFLLGNRQPLSDVRLSLLAAIEKHITEYGVITFTVGNYGNFDRIVQSVLKELKQQYTDIRLYLLAPYALDKKTDVPVEFDGIYYPDGLEKVPKPFAIVQANRYMIKHSDFLITYCHHIGNTRNIVEYAQKREKRGLIKVTLLN